MNSPDTVATFELAAKSAQARQLCNSMEHAAVASNTNYVIDWKSSLIVRIDQGLRWAIKNLRGVSVTQRVIELPTYKKESAVRNFAAQFEVDKCPLADAFQKLMVPRPSAIDAIALLEGLRIVPSLGATPKDSQEFFWQICAESTFCGGMCSDELRACEAEKMLQECPAFADFHQKNKSTEVLPSINAWVLERIHMSIKANRHFLNIAQQKELEQLAKHPNLTILLNAEPDNSTSR